MDWKLETLVVPVADVDRAKAFYADAVGFHVDVDHRAGEDFRVVQLTPPGSGCSISLMKNEEAAGTLQGLQLVVRDIDEARRPARRRRRGRHRRVPLRRRRAGRRARPRPGRLRIVPLVQRSRRERLAGPGGPEPGRLTPPARYEPARSSMLHHLGRRVRRTVGQDPAHQHVALEPAAGVEPVLHAGIGSAR